MAAAMEELDVRRGSTRSAARCAWASSTTSSAAGSSATSARRPSSSSRRAGASTASTPGGSRRWRASLYRARGRAAPIPAARSASTGPRCCTRPASRSRTPGSTSTARTSSQNADMPGLLGAASRASSRCWCWAAAAAWPKMAPRARRRRLSRRSSWRCASPCCSTTRGSRSTRRASASVPQPATGSAIAGALAQGAPAHRAPAGEGTRRVASAGIRLALTQRPPRRRAA